MRRETIRRWLIDKGVTIWSTFDLTQPERLEAAIDWVEEMIMELLNLEYLSPHQSRLEFDPNHYMPPAPRSHIWEPPRPVADVIPPNWANKARAKEFDVV